MKVKSIPSSWIDKNGSRLDCKPYMGGAVETRVILASLKRKSPPLASLVSDRHGGIYHAGRYKRIWVKSEENGKRFLSSRDVLQSDLSNLNFISNTSIKENPKLLVHKGQVLITRSGTIGRMSYVNDFMDGMSCTEHVMRVEANELKVGSGYLYAFLNSNYGLPMVIEGTYGAMIQHIEPEHIENMPIPRLGTEIESAIDELIKKSAQLRDVFQANINEATNHLFKAAGLKDIAPEEWHHAGPDIGDKVYLKSTKTLRALNFGGRYKSLFESLKSVPHRTLGEVCEDGLLSRGGRFKRIDAEREHGIKLVAQKQGFWVHPEGRWISQRHASEDVVVNEETILIAARGTLGEREVYCRSIFVTGSWLKNAYSEDFLKVFSIKNDMSGAYLYAFLRSETAFRCLRSMSTGSKQQDINVGMISDFPIPVIKPKDRQKVEYLIRTAFTAKDQADEYEKQAIAMVEREIKAAAKTH